jgi:hypothetical protein
VESVSKNELASTKFYYTDPHISWAVHINIVTHLAGKTFSFRNKFGKPDNCVLESLWHAHAHTMLRTAEF